MFSPRYFSEQKEYETGCLFQMCWTMLGNNMKTLRNLSSQLKIHKDPKASMIILKAPHPLKLQGWDLGKEIQWQICWVA